MSARISLEDALHSLRDAAREGTISESTCNNATRWLREEPFHEYQTDIISLVSQKKWDDVSNLFWQVIPFGTGGRRGLMSEFGSATINRRTIAESAHGLATYLKQVSSEDDLTAVVAHDTRHRSPEFAQLTATTLAAHGLKVHFFTEHRSTPELSFAVRHLGCDVGVMISASHNPPSDNGFKAYWSHGGQVLPPHDSGIIDCVYKAGEIPTCDFQEAIDAGKIIELGEEIDHAYIKAVAALSLSQDRDISGLFSPLHGVGTTNVYRVLEAAGFQQIQIDEERSEPDGNFSNVPDQLPNPERPEVFAPLQKIAAEQELAVILASDPDSDRMGVSVRDADGNYQNLTGNQVGALITDYAIRKQQANGADLSKQVVIETVVTSRLIGKIARQAGADVVSNLPVGFKYIGRTVDEKQDEGKTFLIGAEESLGYLAGDYARDKDAAVAALWLMELAAELKQDGKTLLDQLDKLYVAHGYHQEGQFSKVCQGETGQQRIEKILTAFQESPPGEIGDFSLDQVLDYSRQEIRELPSNRMRGKLDVPKVSLLMYESPSGPFSFQFAVRPSGTEPKLKFYLFAQMKCESIEELPQVKSRTAELLDQIRTSLNEWATAAEE
ncbi:MAG: phospho-sugar mutase [Planctomycetaceae bacterium]|nr:phospho-sugar mutase [Planctomycetaceae bacterium]